MTRFSFQLYSARNYPPLADVLGLLSRLGYADVEGFGPLYDDPRATRKLLDDNGLAMPTGHFGLDLLDDHTRTVEIAQALGIETIIAPFIGPDHWKQSSAEWEAVAATLQNHAQYYRGKGFGFAWHNHHFEFWPTPDDGRIPMDILLENAPGLDWEIDVAWVVRGEADPADWIARHGERIVAVHLKDIAPEGEAGDEDGWADLGHGTVPWVDLVPLIGEKTKAGHLVMEHDNPNDLERFASRSIAAAQTLWEDQK